MKTETPLDYAVFQLSPTRSRFELFVSSVGNTEKLASGLVKPFATHLKVAEEQTAMGVQSFKLEIEPHKIGELWFTKGTMEKFVRFVSTPEILELVNTFDAEMSQLETARTIYSQGVKDQCSSTLGVVGSGTTAAADATKKELLRAIDVRLIAVEQDLTTACGRAAAAGFNLGTVSELQMFANQFGAYRLNEACKKFISLCERRPYLINQWKSSADDQAVRSSYGSYMSIDDDPTTEQCVGTQISSTAQGLETNRQQQRFEQSKLSTWQQPNNPSSVTFPLRRSRESSIEKDDNNSGKEKKEESGGSEPEPPATQPGHSARRLSVQDRISLFENKQKGTSSSSTSSGSGGKPIVAKPPEPRRLSSDLSAGSGAVEKAVLRRWSGVSDMSASLDLSGEKKEVDDSTLCTPSVSGKSEFRNIPGVVGDCGSKDQGDYSNKEVGTTKAGRNCGVQLTVSSGRSGESSEPDKSASTFGTVENQGETHSSTSFNQAGGNDRATYQSQFTSLASDGAEIFGFNDQGRSKGSIGIEQTAYATQPSIPKEGGDHQRKPGPIAGEAFAGKSYQSPGGETLNRGEDSGSGNQFVSQTQLRAPQKTAVGSVQFGSDPVSKFREAFAAQHKGSEGVLLDSQSSWKSLGEIEEVESQESEKQSDCSIPKVEDSGIPRMKFQKQKSAREHIRKSQSRKSESSSIYGSNNTVLSGKMVIQGQEGFASSPVTPAEPTQRIRQSKGNQELNDELKMKANELEKLFAKHKLRAPGDQSNSTRRSKHTDMENEQASSLPDKEQVVDINPQIPGNNTATDSSGSSSNLLKLNASSLVKLADSQDYLGTPKHNISDLGLSDDSRGKLYDTYMQKRDAKLREEWSSKRMEKEAKLRAMKDSFEHSRTEMSVKFSGSADRQDSVFSARRRAERLRSLNTRSVLKMEQSEDDEDLPSGRDRCFGDASMAAGVPRSSQTKRLLPNRSLSSSTPRTAAAPLPRSATKASNSSSVRRRMQSENPLVQSVPNFSDLRKENTKPYSATSKIGCTQLRNFSHSRSTSEEIPDIKEENMQRSQSLRKSAASPAEFKEEAIPLTPLKYDIQQTKSVESKPLSQKINNIGRGSGAGDMELKASMVSESLNNHKEADELASDPEDSADVVNVEVVEEFQTRIAEDYGNMDHSLSNAKLINSGSENRDALQSFLQLNPSLLPSSMPPAIHPIGFVQDSLGESLMSWNSRIHHPFSYAHEVSDVDASADSPTGSPASWNLHHLNQTETDAARMRKKWGSTQKPFFGMNSSNNQPRKDVTKGFKRLLHFGRKSRGTESLVDWISATTSEGDDDMEDGRDPANRSSEDLRKSRMGFSHGHASEDTFTENEFLSEQVQALNSSIPGPPASFKLREDHLSGSSIKAPRSFFSLSSFRSKGNESKLR